MIPRLVVGLGNPGPEHTHTRHNVGWRVIDVVRGQFADATTWRRERDVEVAVTSGQARTFFVKPQTFMNASGFPIARFTNFYQIPLDRLLIVHDDLDLPFGELRPVFDRGSAGHQGVESIIEHLGSKAFHRLRIGIGSNRDQSLPAEGYVLQNFSNEEENQLTTHHGVIAKASDWIIDWIRTSTP